MVRWDSDRSFVQAGTDIDNILVIGQERWSVVGTVKTTAGVPILPARVSAVEAGLSTMTDSSGNYTLERVPVVSNTISVTAPWSLVQTALVSVSSGATTTQDFTMASSTPDTSKSNY